RKGMLPATLTAERDPNSDELYLEFESLCNRDILTAWGEKIDPGQPYRFDFDRFEKKMTWMVGYFEFLDSIPNKAVFEGKPKAAQTVGELAFAWWGSPLPEVAADKFATLAETTFSLAPGEYAIELSSDDGVRLYVDDKCVIDRWDIHEPTVDEISLKLGGQHRIRIEHFDAGGFAALDFRVRRVRN
ncbi:MAG: PA14 domain-containing protein, partial [Saprospiraceae bacterium]